MIAFDMPTEQIDTSEKYEAEMKFFRGQQPHTFWAASLVMIGGRLDGPAAELQHGHWDAMGQFFKYAVVKPTVQRMSKIQGVLNVFNAIVGGVGYVFKQTYYGMGWGLNKIFGKPERPGDVVSDDGSGDDP